MVYTLEQLQDKEVPMACINDKWVPARPVNWRYRSLYQRLREAWAVFTGTAECFIWPEGQ